uniref:Ribosome binding factor A n=1 Tax=Rhinolophus ferrumequinum TaxID=59479 RepID=A0A671G5F6_RHIFE
RLPTPPLQVPPTHPPGPATTHVTSLYLIPLRPSLGGHVGCGPGPVGAPRGALGIVWRPPCGASFRWCPGTARFADPLRQEPAQEICLENQIYKPSQLEFPTKSTSKKTKKEDHVRLRALNGLLYKALTDLLCTPQVSQEIYDLNVELSKVSVTWDFSACRVYWKATLSAERDTHAKAVLQRSSTQLRHLLMSQQTLRNVPPIVFIQDKGHAALAEVDRLLAVADFGPPDEKDDVIQNSCRDPEAPDAPPPCDTLGPAVSSSLTGIDHEALSRQIVEYKRRKDKGRGGVSPLWSGPQQVAELTKQKKKRKKCKPCPDNDLSQELPKVGGE